MTTRRQPRRAASPQEVVVPYHVTLNERDDGRARRPETDVVARRRSGARAPAEDQPPDPLECLRKTDVAALLKADPWTLDRWRRLDPTFPAPIWLSNTTPVWRRRDIEAWLQAARVAGWRHRGRRRARHRRRKTRVGRSGGAHKGRACTPRQRALFQPAIGRRGAPRAIALRQRTGLCDERDDLKKIVEFPKAEVLPEEHARRLKSEVDRLASLPVVEWLFYLRVMVSPRSTACRALILKEMIETTIKSEGEKSARRQG